MAERLFYGVSRGTVNSAMWEWGLHFAPTTGIVPEASAVWTVCHDIFYSDPAGGAFPYLQFMRPGQMVVEGAVYEVDVLTDRKISVYRFAGPGGGSGAGANMPPACAIMALWRPLDTARRVRGRTFLPPFSTAILSGGDVDITTTAHIGIQLRRVVTYLTLNGYTPVIRSKRTRTSHPAVLVGVSNRVNYVVSRSHAARPVYSG